ncbi:MFS transporter [Thioclava atlantica]|uniref:MFS-type transporter n=1 Tax=Thioclava atlantica TaxID=1317124 RepID=A0A085TZS3_9RHOB|nr:MFS transporter [Thioclava atlantica]KFE36220.1 MFS-type transporter [Thioclava atlantica]
MTACSGTPQGQSERRLPYWRVSLVALTLAAAGLPIYIHLPRFAVTELGLGLGQVGAVLIAIRIVDFAQDPALGWMIDRWPDRRGQFAGLALLLLGAGFAMLFALPAPLAPALWLSGTLLLLFTGYSLGTILLYGQSTALAGSAPAAQYRLASWREAGLLAGVILAAAAPVAFAQILPARGGYAGFGWAVAALAILSALLSRPVWGLSAPTARRPRLRDFLSGAAGRLLGLAFVNALPVAVTSTLFLFFVEDRLELPGLAGPFLILFFAAAGLSAPLWSRLAGRFGARRVLLAAMVLSIASFIGAAVLPKGAALGFAAICLGSGVALGADMVILPALFASALGRAGLRAGQAFGIWSFAAKLALALAAGVVLPLLQQAGFTPGAENSPAALTALTLAYALLPCGLKLIALAMVFALPREFAEGQG